MDKDDDVLQSDLYENFPEEAVPLIIFNEEKKRKFKKHHHILTIDLYSFRAERRGPRVPTRAQGPDWYNCGGGHVQNRQELSTEQDASR